MPDKSIKTKKIEGPEYGIDSRYESVRERKHDGQELMEARLERMKNLTEVDRLRSKLMQLKLQMLDYLSEPVYLKNNFFTDFLKNYIDVLYAKRKQFAEDMNIKPITLSQVLNNHREPREEFMHKLMIHSGMVYKDVCPFPKETWYLVYFQEKMCDNISNHSNWKSKLHKDVKYGSLLNA